MKRITRSTLAGTATQRWREQYPKTTYKGTPKDDIHAALVALGSRPNPDDVDAAIGNASWTELPTCSECDMNPTDFVVEVGEEEDYDSRTAYLCGACIGELAEMSILTQLRRCPGMAENPANFIDQVRGELEEYKADLAAENAHICGEDCDNPHVHESLHLSRLHFQKKWPVYIERLLKIAETAREAGSVCEADSE